MECKRRGTEDIEREDTQLGAGSFNMRTCISSLPSEILSLIYQEYLHGTEEDYIVEEFSNNIELRHANGEKPPHWRWLVLLQVCRSWRAVVLSSPLLWSQLYPTICEYPDLVETFILRSRNTPLSAFIKSYVYATTVIPANLRQSFGRLLQEETRLRHLSFEAARLGFEHTYGPLVMDVSLKHLESLKIQLYDDDAHDGPLEGLPVILKADFRCLRDVILGDIFPEWPLFRNLPPTVTSLRIQNEYQPSIVHGSMDDVFTLLKKLGRLKTLKLIHCLPIFAHGAIDSIHMPELEQLTITSPASSAISLFESLELSVDTIIRLELMIHPGEDVSGGCSTVFSHLYGIYGDSMTHTSIWVDQAKVTLILAKNFILYFNLDVMYQDIDDGTTVFQPLTVLHDTIDAATTRTFSSVTSLWISVQDCDARDVTESAMHVFRAMNNLGTLGMDVNGAVVSDVLRPRVDTPILLPHLYNLALPKFDIVDGELRSEDSSVNIDMFCRCLEERQACGCGIMVLQIRDGFEVDVSDPEELRDRLDASVRDTRGWME
ncbi:hypothetical protein QCA50_009763 [Cerrena zonata]|uniref:F-box domain-containing protein n=1 Tax=Cerrena zonata TaxID=2478898 RepID=A0AAW0GBE3_9APHY